MKTETKYKSFYIIVADTVGGFAWEIRRADGSLYEEGDDEFDTEDEALEEAKLIVDQFYTAD